MDEKTLIAFAKWMQAKDTQLAQIPTEQLAQQLVQALQTEEGQKQLAPLFQQFQQEAGTEIFKKGGRMDQAVKKMQTGDKYNKYSNTLESQKVPSKHYHNEVWDGGHLYKKIDGVWHTTPDPDYPGHRKEWSPVERNFDHLMPGSPSTDELNDIRASISEYHPEKTIGHARYILNTAPIEVTEKEAIAGVKRGENYSKPETWYKNGVDSTFTVVKTGRTPSVASNQDWQTKAYRNNTWYFRDIADFFGWKPSFIRYSEEYNKEK